MPPDGTRLIVQERALIARSKQPTTSYLLAQRASRFPRGALLFFRARRERRFSIEGCRFQTCRATGLLSPARCGTLASDQGTGLHLGPTWGSGLGSELIVVIRRGAIRLRGWRRNSLHQSGHDLLRGFETRQSALAQKQARVCPCLHQKPNHLAVALHDGDEHRTSAIRIDVGSLGQSPLKIGQRPDLAGQLQLPVRRPTSSHDQRFHHELGTSQGRPARLSVWKGVKGCREIPAPPRRQRLARERSRGDGSLPRNGPRNACRCSCALSMRCF